MSARLRDRLVALLRERSFERKKVVLASGRESDFFIDCKQTVLTAEGHALVGELLFDLLRDFPRLAAVAGVELGGCPLASAVSLRSFQRGAPIDAIYVRKDAKDHGSKRDLEGNVHLAPNSRVVLVEDVITTGGSAREVIEVLKGFDVPAAAVAGIVNRSGGNPFAKDGLELSTLCAVQANAWKPEACPLCQAGGKAIKPGSRPQPA